MAFPQYVWRGCPTKAELEGCSEDKRNGFGVVFLWHKEDLVVREADERISSAVNANVVVTAGMHWDDIDEAGIAWVMENTRELVGMIIERIGTEMSGQAGGE